MPNWIIAVLMVGDDDIGKFCCGIYPNGVIAWNSTSQLCVNATYGSYDPFELPAGRIIYNRTSGSTSFPNVTLEQTVTITQLSQPTISAAASSPSTQIQVGS